MQSNIFFLTNTNRNRALAQTWEYSSNDQSKHVLFHIEANPQIPNVKSFANIGSIGYENDSNDILFMLGSLFKISEIEDEKDGIINIKMSLCALDETNKSKELYESN